MSRRALLLVNRSKPEVRAALEQVRSVIASGGGTVVGELEAMVDGPLSHAETNNADLLMILGGDGTILSQARRCVHLKLPLLGLNFGKLGFMAEFDLQSLQRHAAAIFGSGPMEPFDRRMMEVTVKRAVGGGTATNELAGLALNDCVITAGEPFRMIEALLSIDGLPGPTAAGDGVVVATPVGSTAYNASAGGPIMAPDVDAMVITPIAAQSLSFRPVVVRGTSVIKLTMARVNSGSGGVGGTALVLDGQIAGRLNRGDEVIIRSHPEPVRFVRNPEQEYWSTLIQKMHWATRPRLRGEEERP